MRIARNVVSLTLLAALALTASGCGNGKSGKVQAVTADPSVKGSITVYTSAPKDKAESYLSLFKKEYPNVTVTLVQDTAEAIADKLIKEKKAPVADVVWHTSLSSLKRAQEASALAPYAYHPGQLDSVSSDYRDSDNLDNPLFTGTDARLIAFAVNSQVLDKAGAKAPATIDDLTDPKFSGQLVLPSIKTEAGYTLFADLIPQMDEQTAWQFFDKLDKNVAYYTNDENAPIKAVSNGEAGVGISFDGPVVAAVNSGDSLDAVFPQGGSPYELDVDALVNKPSPSAAAKAFLDWGISDAAVAAYAADTPITAVQSGTQFPSGYPADPYSAILMNNDFQWTSNNRAKVVAEWMKRYGSKIK